MSSYEEQKRASIKEWVNWYKDDIAWYKGQIEGYKKLKEKFPNNKDIQDQCDTLIDHDQRMIIELKDKINKKLRGE